MSNPLWQTIITPIHGFEIRESHLLDVLNVAFVQSARGSPGVFLCGAPQAAAIRAHVDFQGRDRRRIKREVNKAMRRARKDRHT